MDGRVKALEGVVNFRDFGGYAGLEGAMVRAGLLFRSAHFAEASGADRAALDRLGVSAVTDLRRPEERAAQPNMWPGQGVKVFENDTGQLSKPPHVAFLEEAELTANSVRSYMIATYAHIPFEPRYTRLFGDFLRHAAHATGGTVAHCAAGKDRTGIIVAVTQLLLGVGKDGVYADYEMTNTVVDLESRLPRMRAVIAERYGVAVSEDVVRPMVGVHADYLRHGLASIMAQCGSIEGYAEQVIGLGAGDVAALRERLLA